MLSPMDPIERFLAWYDDARARIGPDADAAALATATLEGRPSVRIVLFRGLSDGGLRFFTNYESRKAGELESNPFAALCFHWAALGRQVRVEGRVERLPPGESDDYFRSRPREAQLSALASPQSRPIASHDELLARHEAAAREWSGRDIPRPARWGGYRVLPDTVELWTSGEHRLHQRLQFTRTDGGWREERLGP
jgi:pyridoxamine 5'-phosphate oxidase